MKTLFIATPGERGEAMKEVLGSIIPDALIPSSESADIIAFYEGRELVERQNEFPGKTLIVYRQIQFHTARLDFPPNGKRIHGEQELRQLCEVGLPVAA